MDTMRWLRQLLLGGDTVSTISLEHLYAIHSYLLAAVAFGLSFVHLASTFINSLTPVLPLSDPATSDEVEPSSQSNNIPDTSRAK